MNSIKRQEVTTLEEELQVSRCPIYYWKKAEKLLQKEWRTGSKWKWHSAVDVSGGESKALCCKKQYCIETSMNQGKLHAVKKEMGRVNIKIIGNSELKWMEMSELILDDHYIYYCRQESHRRNGVALTVNKTDQNAVLQCYLKNERMILVHLTRQTIQHHSNSSLCPNHWCQRCWSWAGLEKSVRSTRTDTKKMFFLHRGLEWK